MHFGTKFWKLLKMFLTGAFGAVLQAAQSPNSAIDPRAKLCNWPSTPPLIQTPKISRAWTFQRARAGYCLTLSGIFWWEVPVLRGSQLHKIGVFTHKTRILAPKASKFWKKIVFENLLIKKQWSVKFRGNGAQKLQIFSNFFQWTLAVMEF